MQRVFNYVLHDLKVLRGEAFILSQDEVLKKYSKTSNAPPNLISDSPTPPQLDLDAAFIVH